MKFGIIISSIAVNLLLFRKPMARYFFVFTLLLCAPAHAGAAVSLSPAVPANGLFYMPGETVNVDVMVQLTAGTPSVPGPGGTTTSIRVRFLQFDFSDSSPELDIRPVSHHPGSDRGPIPFWDFSGSTSCADDETACGANYFIDGNMSDDLVSLTFIGDLNPLGSQMITLSQVAPKRVGEFSVTLPLEPCGDYRVDVLNADDANPDHGAEIGWGFGSTNDPTDPTSPLRANNLTAGGSGIVMAGQENGLVWSTPPCIPEPVTLALLGLGGLAIPRRRLHSD